MDGPVLSRLLAGVLAAVVIAGCGAAEATRGSETTPVTIQVDNDLSPSTAVTVWVAHENAPRQRLGDIGPLGSERFTYRRISPGTDQYRLVAKTTEGRTVTSRVFTLSGERGIRWDIDANVVDVTSKP